MFKGIYWCGYRLLDLRCLQVLKVFGEVCKIYLKCGYFTGNEPNLRTNSVLLRSGINHSVKIVNILLKSGHIRKQLN